jgi:hypothetical protein
MKTNRLILVATCAIVCFAIAAGLVLQEQLAQARAESAAVEKARAWKQQADAAIGAQN